MGMKANRIVLCSVISLAGAGIGIACCAVSKMPVVFGGQTNLIVWDADRHYEHFFRAADFQSQGPDLGFIAPTPSAPVLAKASSAAFRRLAALEPPPPRPLEFMPTGSMDVAIASKSVEVIQSVDVAGYHATTLKANDSQALANWMKANGYRTSPSIQRWTEFYIRKGWCLTAFKVNAANGFATTGTVRMSFATPEPFNPYYVPKDNENAKGTLLKLYFVANHRFTPTVGTSRRWVEPKWRADVPSSTGFALADDLGLLPEAIPAHAEVTVYEDPNFTRGAADDLFFHREDPLPPLALCLAIGAGLTLLVWKLSKVIPRRSKS
jgi:Uncharacterized protein conserved in bacteria (DUF2330)